MMIPPYIPTLDISSVESQSLPWTMFLSSVLAEHRPYLQSSNWDINVEQDDQASAEKLTELVQGRCRYFSRGTRHAAQAFVDLTDGLGWVWYSESRLGMTTAFKQPGVERHQAFLEEVRKHFPIAVPQDDNTIQVRFWMLGSMGAREETRRLEVPTWTDIALNYPPSVVDPLAGLMKEFEPARGGQLILWHGPPGTGKTFAIRALAYAWRKWCDIDYVVDPDAFFGSASYMMGVVMATRDGIDLGGGESGKEVQSHPLVKHGRWRLLILEDSGELLAEDARQREGQALSRFLNLADGMIGQGLKIITLVTTNEPLGTLHPAVARPGRCSVEVEFQPFTTEEAQMWLKNQQVEPSALSTKQTLAQLYGIVEGFTTAKGSIKRRLGLGNPT